MPVKLCQACQRMIRAGLCDDGKYAQPVHDDFASFRESILADCVLCTYMWQRALDFPDSKVCENSQSPKSIVKDINISYFDMKFNCHSGGFVAVSLRLNSHPLPGIPSGLNGEANYEILELHEFSDGQKLAPEAEGVEGRLAQTRQWLLACKETHPECHQYRSATLNRLPTRLLDLEDSNSGSYPRIVGPSTEAISTCSYATLSHCWGSHQPIKLLNETNLGEISARGEILADLPQTFSDAVKVCKAIGIRYLWIDSLCIIQDNTEDWRSESRRMHEVYENADINIAATGARDCTEGLFLERNHDETLPWRAVLEPSDGVNEIHCEIDQFNFWYEEVEQEPLHKRGWVMQERLLSPRIVHFGRTRMYWECPHGTSYENHVDQFEHTGDSEVMKSFKRATRRASHEGDAADRLSIGELIPLWGRIVAEYSPRSLTKSADKLIAIEGLASKLRAVSGEEYLWGFWRSHLIQQLLWTPNEREGVKRADYYRAPSWSWASYDGGVLFPIGLFPKVGEGEDAHSTALANVEPFACGSSNPPRTSSIRLHGCLVPAEQIQGMRETFTLWPDDGSSRRNDPATYLGLILRELPDFSRGLLLQPEEDTSSGNETFVRKGTFAVHLAKKELVEFVERIGKRIVEIV